MRAPSGAGPISDGSPAPWVLPNVWPPAISATVSSSFIAMRKNVSRMSLAAATGSGLAFAAVAFVPQPRSLGTPVELFGLPNVGATAAETECLEAHRVERDVAGKNHQIGPGDFPAVLLLDRPQQPARLVEVRVVRPRVERCETLLAGAGAAAAVGDAVGARAVPRHADHQSAVVAKVGRPPLLRLCHQGMEVLDHGLQVEA